MDQNEKAEFLKGLSNSILKSLLARLSCFPEEWNGVELRQLLADRTNLAVFKMPYGRKRAYNKTVLAKDLLQNNTKKFCPFC